LRIPSRIAKACPSTAMVVTMQARPEKLGFADSKAQPLSALYTRNFI
jgi:hypothetical protein